MTTLIERIEHEKDGQRRSDLVRLQNRIDATTAIIDQLALGNAHAVSLRNDLILQRAALLQEAETEAIEKLASDDVADALIQAMDPEPFEMT